jgi:phosphoribosylamine--glycine ligase
MNGAPKLKFLFVSHIALIGDMVWQIKKEGHDVKYFIKDKPMKDVCDGFVDKTDDWQKNIDWADVIVFDDTEFAEYGDKLRKQGKKVIGGSVYGDKLELDREFGQNEMKEVGMTTLPHWEFSDFDEAIKFLDKNPDRYVLKPIGEADNEKHLLYVGQESDGKDVQDILRHYKKNWSKLIKKFQLQKHVLGVEVAVGAFFNGTDFITPININFEHKRMFNGDIGPSTGEMGTSMFWSQPNRIFNETLGRMKDKLAAAGYVGYIDINTIVNAKGIYPLEFTSRFGYPTISIHMEGITSKMGTFMHALANNQPFELKTKKGFQVGVVIACPPFPFDDPEAFKRYSEDATILFKKPDLDGVHLGDVKLVDGDWHLAGNMGYALVITGSGTTMEEARSNAYYCVKNIMIPNMFYRTDIGQKWRHEGDMLRTWGYLN